MKKLKKIMFKVVLCLVRFVLFTNFIRISFHLFTAISWQTTTRSIVSFWFIRCYLLCFETFYSCVFPLPIFFSFFVYFFVVAWIFCLDCVQAWINCPKNYVFYLKSINQIFFETFRLGDIVGCFLQRITTQLNHVKHLFQILFDVVSTHHIPEDGELTRDAFGLHTIIVIVTKTGKVKKRFFF